MKVSELLVQEPTPISEAVAKAFKPGDPLSDVEGVLDAFTEFSFTNEVSDTAHEKAEEDPDDGAMYLVRELEMWLDDGDYDEDDLEEFLEKNQDAIYEHFIGGLT